MCKASSAPLFMWKLSFCGIVNDRNHLFGLGPKPILKWVILSQANWNLTQTSKFKLWSTFLLSKYSTWIFICRNLGRCARQNMPRPYLKIWEWELIFGHAVKTISSPDICSPWPEPILRLDIGFGSLYRKLGFGRRVLWEREGQKLQKKNSM